MTSNSIDKKILSKICFNLNRRIPAAIKDLKIIRRSAHLEVWRALHADSLMEYQELLEELKNPPIQRVYQYRVRFYLRKKNRRYWEDRSQKATMAYGRLLDTDYALVKIKNEDVKGRLSEALKQGIIPWRKEDAMTADEIEANLKAGKIYMPAVKEIRKNIDRKRRHLLTNR